MLVLFADSDCDMTPIIAERYGYHIIPMPYIEDGKEILPYVDWDEFDSHTFYNRLRHGHLPSTCGLSPQKYKEYFEPFFKNGDDILYVHFSAKMSSTFNAMRMALDDLKKDYPERKFYSIDTKAISIGALNILEEIGDMILDGKSIDEVMEWSKSEVDHFATYFYADDLKFFARSGRVSGISAKMGNLLGIHPIINMDQEGVMDSVGKVPGRMNALRTILKYVEDLGDEVEKHRVLVVHSDAPFLAERIVMMLKKKYGRDLRIETTIVNPTSGVHCGPDCVGVCFHSKRR